MSTGRFAIPSGAVGPAGGHAPFPPDEAFQSFDPSQQHAYHFPQSPQSFPGGVHLGLPPPPPWLAPAHPGLPPLGDGSDGGGHGGAPWSPPQYYHPALGLAFVPASVGMGMSGVSAGEVSGQGREASRGQEEGAGGGGGGGFTWPEGVAPGVSVGGTAPEGGWIPPPPPPPGVDPGNYWRQHPLPHGGGFGRAGVEVNAGPGDGS